MFSYSEAKAEKRTVNLMIYSDNVEATTRGGWIKMGKAEIEFVDMIRPQSGCKLAEDLNFAVFQHIYNTSNGNPCDGCAHNRGCELLARQAKKEFQRRQENFGKVRFETNAQIAERLGVSKRQASKMKRR